jgi:hypothetical protein
MLSVSFYLFYAHCHYDECCYVECCGANTTTPISPEWAFTNFFTQNFPNNIMQPLFMERWVRSSALNTFCSGGMKVPLGDVVFIQLACPPP